MPLPRSTFLALLCAASTLMLALAACSEVKPRETVEDLVDDDETSDDTGADTEPGDTDADAQETGADTEPDTEPDLSDVVEPPTTIETACMGTLTQNTTRGERVVIDLCPYLGEAGEAGAHLAPIADEAEILTGVAAQGRLGDYLFDTGRARFVVHGPDRRSTPCPFGGTLVDASYLRDDGTWTPDNVGEVCLLFQLGRTYAPGAASFEILRDGSEGGAAVLAVTSADEISDWINLSGMIEQYVGALLELPVDPNLDHGLTITQYFIARPDTNHVTILTAVRNDGDARHPLLLGDLIDSGGVVRFFNPESSLRGFGYEEVVSEPMSMLAFVADGTSHAYVPLVRGFDEQGRVQVDASYLAVSGVAVPMLGTKDLLATALSANFRRAEGVVDLAPGFWNTWERRFYVGDGDLSSITDPVYGWREQPVGRVSGRVVDTTGAPIADVPVAAIRTLGTRRQAETRFRTDADGRFSGLLPVGETYELVADPADRLVVGELEPISVTAGAELTLDDITASAVGRLELTVVNGVDGSPMPAKVTVLCPGPCPRRHESQLRDINRDPLGADVAAVFHVGVDGTLSAPLAPGNYEVVVSRGMTWTVWPPGAPGQGPTESAQAVTIPADGSGVQLAAELFPAVDRSGFIGADFHVHAVNSPDAPVDNLDRVLSFLGSGVELIISTDHDYITDFAPYVQALGAEGVVASMVGVELTTFDYGHTNAFPLVGDPSDLTGGALDWAVPDAAPLHPAEIFAALAAHPGDQVVQVNHGLGGYFDAIELDVARGISLRDPTDFRMAPVTPGADGDTGLYAEDFTAMEVLNGYGMDNFWGLMNVWFAMAANGFTPTLTAASDTHKLYSDIAGNPRTFVEVGAQFDTIATFDPQQFVQATNALKAFGTTGPFVRVTVRAADGSEAGLGGTVSSGGALQPVTLAVDVQTPLWMHAERVTVYGEVLDSAQPAGESKPTPPEPVAQATLAWSESDLVHASTTEAPAVGYRKTVELVVTPEQDTVYLVVVDTPSESAARRSLFPVVFSKSAPTLAYTNAVFVDVDGNGVYDAPGAIAPAMGQGGSGGLPPAPARPITAEDIERLREALHAEHGDE